MTDVIRGTLIAILAAGASRRMGAPKLLRAYEGCASEETCLLDHAITVASSSKAEHICVVTGAYHETMGKRITSSHLKVIFNPYWERGQSSSVIAALHHCRALTCNSLLIMLADQPFVTGEVLDRMLKAMEKGSADAYRSVAPGYRGSPCGFRQSCFSYLENLSGDEGARQLLRMAPDRGLVVEDLMFDDGALFEDVDTPEDFEKLLRGIEGRYHG